MAEPFETQIAHTAEESDLSPRARASAIYRECSTKSAKEDGDKNTLWISAISAISNTSLRYTRFNRPINEFVWDMHDLWHLFYHASMNINEDRPEQDRLVGQVLYARELGILKRKGKDMEVIGEAVTTQGKIWKDLPFLVEDMTDYWTRDCGTMTKSQRMNFASFLAKLSAVGVGESGLCGCALVILRETLETKRPLVNAVTPEVLEDGEHNRHGTENLSVADLLPAANMWLFKAGNKVIELSQNSEDLFPAQTGALGELAQAEGIVPAHGGFSPQRWLFWLKRLEELENEASGEDKELAAFAQGVRNNMILMAGESDSEMSRELEHRGLLLF